ncbi:MAG: hypothetical protein JW778_04535 [Candidatus Altiarchaeota archaeon]|nr:hypothetical protein [Candidatus Altiarchaeota archaeon]
MDKFRIEVGDLTKYGDKSELRGFSHENPNLHPLDVYTFAEISVYFNGELINSPRAKEKGWNSSATAYLLNFFQDLLSEKVYSNGEQYDARLDYGGPGFYFKRTGENMEVSFGPSPPNEYSRVTVSYLDFLEEVLRASGEFLDKLFEINSKLKDHEDIAALIKEREQVKALYERLKNESK